MSRGRTDPEASNGDRACAGYAVTSWVPRGMSQHPITETTLRAPSKRGGPRHSVMEEFTRAPPWCRHCFAQHQGEPSELTTWETSCRDDPGCPCCRECHSTLLSILFLVPRIEPKTLHMLGRDLPETTFPDQPLGIPQKSSFPDTSVWQGGPYPGTQHAFSYHHAKLILPGMPEPESSEKRLE